MDGNTLKNIRLELNATQSALADALHVTQRQVINWEKGKYPVPFLVEHFVKQMALNNKNKMV